MALRSLRELTFVLFQMDEAKRYIVDGRIEQLRTALLLLDNAAEVQLVGHIRWELWKEQTENQTRDLHLNEDIELLGDDIFGGDGGYAEYVAKIKDREPLTEKRIKKIERYFEDKVRFLSVRRERLDERLVRPIIYLHGYRNETYHGAHVRTETIATAAALYLEINCLMLTSMAPASSGYSSADDYSWLEERFGITQRDLFMGEAELSRIVDDIRSGVLPTPESLAATLADHLDYRFAELDEALQFIVDAHPTGRISDKEMALREAQFTHAVEAGEEELAWTTPDRFRGTHTLISITRLQRRIEPIRASDDRLEAFRLFSEVEEPLESIEEVVTPIVIMLDKAIQDELDRRRGK